MERKPQTLCQLITDSFDGFQVYLNGEEATNIWSTESLGGSPSSDVLQLVVNGEVIASIPYSIHSQALEQLINTQVSFEV